MDTLAARLLDLLPQTQCTRCGYPDCAAYAEAISVGEAGIDQCPPGGAEGIARLARATGQPIAPLDPGRGVEGPRAVAFIDEAWCIGCTLCLDACPTDAIVGANKRMHTVIEKDCTGCELCVPVCPVDCILLENASGARTGWDAWSPEQAERARERYVAHEARLAREARAQSERFAERAASSAATATTVTSTAAASADPRRAIIEAALAKARERKPTP